VDRAQTGVEPLNKSILLIKTIFPDSDGIGNVKIVSKEEAGAAALNHFILHQDIINNYAMS
jgi:hypothetical protein